MAYPARLTLADRVYAVAHANVTAATASGFCAVEGRGEVIRFSSVILGAITGANETLNLYKNGTDTGYDITVTQASSAAGDYDSTDIAPGALTVEAGDVLSVVSANASGGDVGATIHYVVRET